MAIMDLRKRMVFWRIYLDNQDITPHIGHYLDKMEIVYNILPTTKGEDKAPSKATLSITSKNYIENWFIEGRKAQIYVGYDITTPYLIFSGEIRKLPEGSAKDMLNFTVELFGEELGVLGSEQKRRVFKIPYKTNVIGEIMVNYNYMCFYDIADTNLIVGKYAPMQREMTDLEALNKFANDWNCVFWFELPNYFFFVDSDKAHFYKDDYYLGYRTDKTACNVESIEWKHVPARAATELNSGIFGFNENGEVTGVKEYSVFAPDINGKWATWELQPQYLRIATQGTPEERMKMAKDMYYSAKQTFTLQGYNALRKYYQIVKYDDSTSPDAPPAFADSGFDITVYLNEGDPTLFPPRNAFLFSGALNPRADSSQLPSWLFRYGKKILGNNVACLKINEVILSYEEGMLKNKLGCTMGMFI